MKRVIRLSLAALLSVVASVNFLAFMQARAMTRFLDHGERAGRPEQLSVLDKLSVLFSGVSMPRPSIRRTPADFGLSFESYPIPSDSGATLEAWFLASRGHDRPVIALFHGYGASKSTLLSAAQVFQQLGYAALLVDFYGSGGSSGSGTTIGVKEADDVSAVAKFVRRTWPERKIVLYGFSMGAAAVLRAVALNEVEADALIIEAVFDTLLNTGKSRFRAMGLPASPLAELLLFWGSMQNAFNAFAHNPVDYARAVKQPVLVLHGELDGRATLDQARRVASALGAHARLTIYGGVPHVPIVDARREEWRRSVAEFLASIH